MGSEFLRMKGILDQIRETEDETKQIAEVSWIKANLDSNGYKSEWVLGYLLKKLKQIVVSMKVLEATMIGKSVSRLQKHTSRCIRQTARMLIRSWRSMVDEWMIAHDNASVSHDYEEVCGGSNKNTRSGVVETMSLEKKNAEERLEAAKRKLREGYKAAENAKKQRRLQVIDVHDILRLGLAPKYEDSRFRNHIRPCVGLVR
ncbi:hypothetical protein R6Q59_023228 [Mikania micrantha]